MQPQPYLNIQVQIMLFAIIFKTMLTDGSLSPTPVEIEYKLLKKDSFILQTSIHTVQWKKKHLLQVLFGIAQEKLPFL